MPVNSLLTLTLRQPLRVCPNGGFAGTDLSYRRSCRECIARHSRKAVSAILFLQRTNATLGLQGGVLRKIFLGLAQGCSGGGILGRFRSISAICSGVYRQKGRFPWARWFATQAQQQPWFLHFTLRQTQGRVFSHATIFTSSRKMVHFFSEEIKNQNRLDRLLLGTLFHYKVYHAFLLCTIAY